MMWGDFSIILQSERSRILGGYKGGWENGFRTCTFRPLFVKASIISPTSS